MDRGDRTLANSNNFANNLSIYSSQALEAQLVPEFSSGKGIYEVVLMGQLNGTPKMLIKSSVPIEHVALLRGDVQAMAKQSMTITWGPIVEGTLLRNKMLTLSNKPALQLEQQTVEQTFNSNAMWTDFVTVDELHHMHVSSKYYHSDEWGIEIALGGMENPAIPGGAVTEKVFKGTIRVMV